MESRWLNYALEIRIILSETLFKTCLMEVVRYRLQSLDFIYTQYALVPSALLKT